VRKIDVFKDKPGGVETILRVQLLFLKL
jgi:hypothetical protein